MAILDRIKYDGNLNEASWLVHKYPSEQFVLGSQLVVNQGQEALFLKGGEALDLFGPGTHTLSTGNLPILNKLVNLPFGGKTPFTAEVYYVNKTANLNLKWGTATPIPVEDPKYGVLLDIGSHGQYGITINDTRLFVSRIIGAVPNGSIINYKVVAIYFNGLINTKIKSLMAEYMVKKQSSFLEVSVYLEEFSVFLKNALTEEFERFGIELLNFYCEAIEPTKSEQYEKLRRYKEEIALGMDFYQQRRSLDIMEKLVDNPSAGGIANAGIGLGMGLGAVGQFGNVFSGLTQSVNTTKSDIQMACPKCGNQNSATMKFCGNCGNRLAVTEICPHCGNEVPVGMKFCGECGKSLSVSKCKACGYENKAGMKFCGNCGEKI